MWLVFKVSDRALLVSVEILFGRKCKEPVEKFNTPISSGVEFLHLRLDALIVSLLKQKRL
jgi:hypothetical protein